MSPQQNLRHLLQESKESAERLLSNDEYSNKQLHRHIEAMQHQLYVSGRIKILEYR